MRTRAINPGDLVRVNRRGRLFHARVTGLDAGGLTVEPIERGISYRRVSARDVVDHWTHTVATRRADRGAPGQTTLDELGAP